ncbi:hypothetical protein V8F33_013883 [Rhypophila sp. PSN 637]
MVLRGQTGPDFITRRLKACRSGVPIRAVLVSSFGLALGYMGRTGFTFSSPRHISASSRDSKRHKSTQLHPTPKRPVTTERAIPTARPVAQSRLRLRGLRHCAALQRTAILSTRPGRYQ